MKLKGDYLYKIEEYCTKGFENYKGFLYYKGDLIHEVQMWSKEGCYTTLVAYYKNHKRKLQEQLEKEANRLKEEAKADETEKKLEQLRRSAMKQTLVATLIVLSTYPSITKAQEPTRAYLLKECPEKEPEVTVLETCKIVQEKSTERVIEKIVEKSSKNRVSLLGGITSQDYYNYLDDVQLSQDNAAKEPMKENYVMYGAGYDRSFGFISVGAGYLRNKKKTNEMVTINFGLNW